MQLKFLAWEAYNYFSRNKAEARCNFGPLALADNLLGEGAKASLSPVTFLANALPQVSTLVLYH